MTVHSIRPPAIYYTAFLKSPNGKRIAVLDAALGICALRQCTNPATGVVCRDCWFKGWEGEK